MVKTLNEYSRRWQGQLAAGHNSVAAPRIKRYHQSINWLAVKLGWFAVLGVLAVSDSLWIIFYNPFPLAADNLFFLGCGQMLSDWQNWTNHNPNPYTALRLVFLLVSLSYNGWTFYLRVNRYSMPWLFKLMRPIFDLLAFLIFSYQLVALILCTLIWLAVLLVGLALIYLVIIFALTRL